LQGPDFIQASDRLLLYVFGCSTLAAHLFFHPSDEDLSLGAPACRQGGKAQIYAVRNLVQGQFIAIPPESVSLDPVEALCNLCVFLEARILAGARAVLQLLYTETTAAEWLFP
jgi:hypothetical protein